MEDIMGNRSDEVAPYQLDWDNEIDWADSPNVLQEIANYIFTSKYARYLPKLQRRETWDEAVDRDQNMHLKRFKGDKLTSAQRAKIRWAFDKVRDRKVLPSMRSMQYAGPAIEAHHERGFNCSVRHIDSIRAFAEVFFLLLCGCGVGLGLTKKHVNHIPALVSAKDRTGTTMTYVIADTIEGWSDSVEALLLCYTKNNPFSGRKIVFDYSRIRDKGAILKIGGGKAPGYEPLKAAHLKIKKLLEWCIEEQGQQQLLPINVYDIIMHTSDAVLSGGLRRAATIVLFDKDDENMLNAKIGNWFDENPQRARSNNSVLLLRNNLSFEEFQAIMQRTRDQGEPGMLFVDHEDTLANPCQPGWASVLTPEGLRTFNDIEVGDKIWSETGWVRVSNKWSTGVKEVFRYQTTVGSFYGTQNHRLVSSGAKIPAGECDSVDVLSGPLDLRTDKLIPEIIMDGLVLGDGSIHAASNNLVYLIIGKDDSDYFNSEIKGLIKKHRPGLHKTAWEIQTTLTPEELPKTYNRIIPDRFIYGTPQVVASFLRGLYSANGSVVSNGRITLKTSSVAVRDSVQLMLSSVGIKSYFTTNLEKTVEFSNGAYVCKESYDVNITADRVRFYRLIGFIQGYKNKKLERFLDISGRSKQTFDINAIEYVSTEEVFDITVDNDTHTYWTGGLNVSNCSEIIFIPVTQDGRTGVQFCNLSSINGALITNEQDYLEAVEAAAIIGTLQATYTDFPYLSSAAEELTKEEALLGVSMTAMTENPTVLLDPVMQQRAATKAVETNKQWAAILGINQAARVTCVKPEGSGSLAVGTMASGIHAAEDHWMFRRVQANKIDPVYLHFKEANPHMVEESIWSANKTDDVITFPVRIPDSAMVKRDLDALTHLNMIKSTQENWVLTGTTEANKKPIAHSVSCTVLVKEHEWEQVTNYLYLNRSFFSAVSLLPDNGGKIYAQAPVESVQTEAEFQHFKELLKSMQSVDYTTLIETEDATELQNELACGGGQCELI